MFSLGDQTYLDGENYKSIQIYDFYGFVTLIDLTGMRMGRTQRDMGQKQTNGTSPECQRGWHGEVGFRGLFPCYMAVRFCIVLINLCKNSQERLNKTCSIFIIVCSGLLIVPKLKRFHVIVQHPKHITHATTYNTNIYNGEKPGI